MASRSDLVPGWWAAFACTAIFAVAGLARSQDGKRLALSRHAEADGGESHRIDLSSMTRSYARLKEEFASKIQASASEARSFLEEPLDAGLPGCRYTSRSSRRLPVPVPESYRDQSLLLLSTDDQARAEKLARHHPEATILVARASRVSEAAGLAKILGRPVGVATAELVRSIGVTCTPCLVTVDAKGEQLELVEGE